MTYASGSAILCYVSRLAGVYTEPAGESGLPAVEGEYRQARDLPRKLRCGSETG